MCVPLSASFRIWLQCSLAHLSFFRAVARAGAADVVSGPVRGVYHVCCLAQLNVAHLLGERPCVFGVTWVQLELELGLSPVSHFFTTGVMIETVLFFCAAQQALRLSSALESFRRWPLPEYRAPARVTNPGSGLFEEGAQAL